MTTLSALVDDTYAMLYGMAQAERPAEDTLASNVTNDSDVSWDFTTAAMWKRNDYAEAADGVGEIVVFADDHPDPGDATVRRGQRGTTAKVAGYSSGDVFYKNPKYPRYEVERIIQQVIRNDLWPHVWTWHKDSLSFSTGDTTYTLDQYVEDVVRVSQYNLNSEGKWYPIPRKYWDVERQVSTTVATNSALLRLHHVFDDSATVYYTAKRRPHVDDLANMADEVAELVPWAATGKLLTGRAGARTQRPRSDREADDGTEYRDYRGFMSEFLRMRDQLRRQLHLDVPPEPRFRQRVRRKAW